jgi:ABC-type multidrug transport system fused ATPase/permease subunit
LRNEVGWFDEEEHNSSLVAARLATDAADVKSAIAERISVILQNMTSLLTSFIVAFIVEWRVSLLILATFPLLVLANFAQVSRSVLQNNNASITFLLVFSSIVCESWSNTFTYPQSHASLERAQQGQKSKPREISLLTLESNLTCSHH